VNPLKNINLRYVLTFFAGILIYFLISAIIFLTTGHTMFGRPVNSPPARNELSNTELAAFAFEVLEFISEEDFISLSEMVHPDFGLVFSPGATITLNTNMRFSAEQVAQFSSDNQLYIWGIDSDGAPIELTPIEYFNAFVLSSDYLSASLIGIDRIVRTGNALENISDEFPGIRFVDFHIPADDRNTSDDLDWSSLRLGFEAHKNRLWLSVIVHSTWTV